MAATVTAMRPVQGRRRQQHAAHQLTEPRRAEALRQCAVSGRVPADRRKAATGEPGVRPAQRVAGARSWPHGRGGWHGLHPAGPAQCAAAARPAEGSCLSDAAACLDNRREAPRPRWKQGAGKACPACACSWPIAGMTRPGRRPRRMRRSNRPSSIPHWPASNCLCRAGMAASATRHRPVQRRWKRIRRCRIRSSRPRWVRRWSKP